MRPRLLALLLMLGALWAGHAAAPPPILACSCVSFSMAEIAVDEQQVIFSGEVLATGPAGVDVRVARWYKGDPSPTVSLDPAGFGDQDAACQIPPPRIGSMWIWAAWLAEPDSQPHVSLCSLRAELGTAEGRELEAQVRGAFGDGTLIGAPPDDPPPAVGGPPLGGVGPGVVLAAVGVAVLVLFGGVVVLARRGGRNPY